jgi:hypothetical protein
MAELNLKKDVQNDEGLFSLVADTTVSHEASEEFSLPDYVPEIRRLLHVRPGVLPESKYISDTQGGTSVEFGGTLTYLVIYTDDEGKLCSLPLTSAYEADTVLSSHPTLVFIDTVVDTVSPRVNAPSRITIKSKLKSKITGWENAPMQEKIEGKSSADELFIERLSEVQKSMSIKQISLQGITVSDKLDIGQGGLRPLWCDAAISINDARAQGNSVSVRGEVQIKCLCQQGGETVTIRKSLPLAEEIDAQGVCTGDMVRVVPRCVSLSVSNEESQGQEQLFFDLTCELEGEAVRNTEISLTKDCYSTKYESEEAYKDINVYSGVRAQNTSFTVNESVKRKSKDIEEIVDIICDPVCEKVDFKSGRAILSGKLNMCIIGKSSTQGEEYQVENYEIPFKYATDISEVGGEIIPKWDITLKEADARLEGDKIALSAILCPAMLFVKRTKQKVLSVSTLKKDKEIKKEAGCVRVYFPKEGDTLWEIAKMYHTTVAALKENNDEDAKTLII